MRPHKQNSGTTCFEITPAMDSRNDVEHHKSAYRSCAAETGGVTPSAESGHQSWQRGSGQPGSNPNGADVSDNKIAECMLR